MKKVLPILLVVLGIAMTIAPCLAAAGLIDCLILGDPSAEPMSWYLRENGGKGEATLLGWLMGFTGLMVFLRGAFFASLQFSTD